ncbi:MAG: ComEC/Rec2 family competence protein [Clostridia bacterium]|nr:ComEC/Rec2 family competence protein [Clostridia bacterium]
MSKKEKNNMPNIVKILLAIVIVIAAIFGKVIINEDGTIEFATDNTIQTVNTDSLVSVEDLEGELEIHFIDVGQADSILIIQGDHNMLIDAGTNDAAETVVDYLNSQGIEKFDYVIGTHPHEDHIGGLDNVISNFDIETFLFPKATANTKTFKDVVSAANAKGLKFTVPNVGSTYQLGDATFEVFAPNSEKYESTNNYSIVIRLTYGGNKFLFTGDAETLSEEEILAKFSDISADLLKIGHHGSYTSTSDEFLKAVNPKYAVISVGKGNSYNHPVKSVMERLKNANIDVYRTDELETIIAVSDGKNITFNVEKGSYDYVSTK